MVGNSILLATGGKVDLAKKWQKGAVIRYISGLQGRIKKIYLDDMLEQIDGVEEFVLYKKEGDEMCRTKSSNDRIGHVIVRGDTAEEALQNCNLAIRCLQIELD